MSATHFRLADVQAEAKTLSDRDLAEQTFCLLIALHRKLDASNRRTSR